MLNLLEDEYISKVLGFSFLKTNSKEDAEDLTQEICVQLIRAIYLNETIDNFNAFVWKVSNNIFFKWLRDKKRSNTAYLNEFLQSDDNSEEQYLIKEEVALLKREIALLSRSYRDAIVMHYFDGTSCSEIASSLHKSAGTVKWWLYDARKFIKEGMTKMREYGEKSYKPGTLLMSCQGNPGANEEPISCAKRKSAQNILLAAYQKPLTIEELCVELGISAPYIEDEIDFLVNNQLLKEITHGKYQTDFVILPNENIKIADKIYDACFPNYYKELMAFLNSNKDLLQSENFNTAGFTWDRLLWVYIHLFTDINLCEFKRNVCKIVKYAEIPERPNGGKWIALGYQGNFFFQPKVNEYKEYQPSDGPVHKGGNDRAQGFFHYWSGLDSSVFFDIPNGVFALCRDIIKGNFITDKLDENQKLLFSIAVEKGLFTKSEYGFNQNYYFIPEEQMKTIQMLAKDFSKQADVLFQKAYNIVLDEYMKDIPKHLHWQMGNFLSNHLNVFVTCSLYMANNDGLLSIPSDHNKSWLSLFASE